MEISVKKVAMISGIILFTVFMIHVITNSPINYSSNGSSTSKTVVVDHRHHHRGYPGYGRPPVNYY